MNQRWTEVLCVLAAGSIARLRGDRMSICSNLQWIEVDGSKGCVNSWEFSFFFIPYGIFLNSRPNMEKKGFKRFL